MSRCSQVTQENLTSLKCIAALSFLTLWHPGLVSIAGFLSFPRADGPAPLQAAPGAVRAVRSGTDSVRKPCHSGMSDFQALTTSHLMTNYLTYPYVSLSTPNSSFAVKTDRASTDMQLGWLIPDQGGSLQSGNPQHDQKVIPLAIYQANKWFLNDKFWCILSHT